MEPTEGQKSEQSSTQQQTQNNNETSTVVDAELTKCLFSQYAMTFASVSSATAYSLYKRPKNGIGIMLVAGASGTFADLIYGWNVSCTEQVAASYQYHEQEKLARLPKPRIKFQGMNEGPK